MHHITIVDDLRETLDLYQELLSEHFRLKLIQDPQALLSYLNYSTTDLIVLDINMPVMSGLKLYSKLIENNVDIPVVFLTGDPSEELIIKGMEMGAKDVIVKPVSLKELVARINNRIKFTSTRTKSSNKIIFDNFILHCDMQCAEVNNTKIQLTPIEYKLIHLFSKGPNKIFTRDYISRLLWPDVHVQNQNIDTHLSNLRKKLLPFSNNIKTIKSRGYILRL